jgi:hypothetical protein
VLDVVGDPKEHLAVRNLAGPVACSREAEPVRRKPASGLLCALAVLVSLQGVFGLHDAMAARLDLCVRKSCFVWALLPRVALGLPVMETQ